MASTTMNEPRRFTEEAEAAGCLCYYNGVRICTPDACPIHGWRENPTPERLEECRRVKRTNEQSTRDFMSRNPTGYPPRAK